MFDQLNAICNVLICFITNKFIIYYMMKCFSHHWKENELSAALSKSASSQHRQTVPTRLECPGLSSHTSIEHVELFFID